MKYLHGTTDWRNDTNFLASCGVAKKKSKPSENNVAIITLCYLHFISLKYYSYDSFYGSKMISQENGTHANKFIMRIGFFKLPISGEK